MDTRIRDLLAITPLIDYYLAVDHPDLPEAGRASIAEVSAMLGSLAASGWVATEGLTLPEAETGKFTLVGGPAEYTQSGGPNITTTKPLNILSNFEGVWSLVQEIGEAYVTPAQLALKIDKIDKGANNGVASLDATGKVPVSQLNMTGLQYKGLYDAYTGAPAITDGTGVLGDLYIVSAAGSRNFGSGTLELVSQDVLIHNGTVYEKAPLNLILTLALNALQVNGINDQWVADFFDYTLNGVGLIKRRERRRNTPRPVAVSAVFDADPTSPVATFVDYHGIDISSNGGDNMNSFTRLYPLESTARFNALSTLVELGKAVGLYSQITNVGLGKVLDGVNIRVRMSNTAAGKITKGIGLHLEAPVNTGGGSFDTYYALKIEPIALAGAIYSGIASDVLRNYFASMQIGVNLTGTGSAAPTELLMLGRAGSRGTAGFYGQLSGKAVLQAQDAAGATTQYLPIRSGIIPTRAYYDATLTTAQTSGQMTIRYPENTYQIGDTIIGTIHQYTRITSALWSRVDAIIP